MPWIEIIITNYEENRIHDIPYPTAKYIYPYTKARITTGEPLVRVGVSNVLGLAIDQHSIWNAHIQKISNKITRSLEIMNRRKWYLPQSILCTIYNSLILPHINYSILVWGFQPSRIFKLQKRAVRMIYNELLFKSLNLLKVEDIFITKAPRFYYKYSQKMTTLF